MQGASIVSSAGTVVAAKTGHANDESAALNPNAWLRVSVRGEPRQDTMNYSMRS